MVPRYSKSFELIADTGAHRVKFSSASTLCSHMKNVELEVRYNFSTLAETDTVPKLVALR